MPDDTVSGINTQARNSIISFKAPTPGPAMMITMDTHPRSQGYRMFLTFGMQRCLVRVSE